MIDRPMHPALRSLHESFVLGPAAGRALKRPDDDPAAAARFALEAEAQLLRHRLEVLDRAGSEQRERLVALVVEIVARKRARQQQQ